MGIEIERKFLLTGESWRAQAVGSRYRQGFVWEVDEFFGDNEGLVIAEIELESEDQQFDLPEWIGEEVTGDPRYFKASLVKKPFSTWKS